MALIVGAALVGLTGNGGPLASASAKVAGTRIYYPQITRWEMDDRVTVRLPRSASGKVDIELSRSFGQLFQLRSVVPEPAEVATTGNGYRFTFDASGSGEKIVTFNVRANEPVLAGKAQVRVAQAPPARLVITVLP